ncbi:MAG TPA: hypothetical protein VFQ38_11560 [Longimicrobiales bacterium]|nr:hypothetical protein [Longimicrobiales bacterium]
MAANPRTLLASRPALRWLAALPAAAALFAALPPDRATYILGLALGAVGVGAPLAAAAVAWRRRLLALRLAAVGAAVLLATNLLELGAAGQPWPAALRPTTAVAEYAVSALYAGLALLAGWLVAGVWRGRPPALAGMTAVGGVYALAVWLAMDTNSYHALLVGASYAAIALVCDVERRRRAA